MSLQRAKDKISIMCGLCPDKKCRSHLYFPNFDSSVECTHCGQRHDRTSLLSVHEVSDMDNRLNDMIRNIVMTNLIPKRGTETVKVLGLSNYHCKLLSPLLTKYGMDKRTGKARLLTDMNQGDIFDCGLFGDRAFLIDPEHIGVAGFGKDVTGSINYLSQTLDIIKRVNENDDRLIPIHADGDGHCLVHAVSRALVGRELFWHPLRCSLKKHFEDNLSTYKEIFQEFVDEDDWRYIIDECDPDFLPPEGELLGLRNIHVFGLANVLKRPIILLDSLECMNSLGDYAALFLPSLVSPDQCKGKDNRLNKPLCIAWSSPSHNHYIPLVGIKKKPLPILPIGLLPKAWGVPQTQVRKYIDFQNGSYCIIGGDRSLGDPYILKLVTSMENLFLEKFGVHPSLVADVHHYLYQSSGVVSADRDMVTINTKKAVMEKRLYRCLTCDAICEQIIKPQWFCAGGVLYNIARLQNHGRFVNNQLYPFPLHGIVCRYDGEMDELQPDLTKSCLEHCTWCNGTDALRKVGADGSIVYKNQDKTKTPSISSTCGCGYKHYWYGKEYDNPPKTLNVVLEWNNEIIRDTVMWFENESDPSLNSNAYQLASEVVQKHFPGEFGSERLAQRVVEQLLSQTRSKSSACRNSQQLSETPVVNDVFSDSMPANKIIMEGTGVLHKEELGLSKTECDILQKIEENAQIYQKKSSADVPMIIDSSFVPESDKIPLCEKMSMPVSIESNIPKVTQIEKFARVVTSDGRQGKLVLVAKGITFNELQTWISDQFDISPENQRIKYGFPLQELQPTNKDDLLTLSHGDRIMVEVIIDPNRQMQFESSDTPSLDFTSPTLSSNIFGLREPVGDNIPDEYEKILEILKCNRNKDMQKLFMTLSFSVGGHISWEQAKNFPELFKHGGLFHLHVKNDIGLGEGKHCNLPSFPNKRFFYNNSTDSIELCASPYGHFTIDNSVDAVIQSARQLNLIVPMENCSIRSSEDTKPLVRNDFRKKGPGWTVLSPPKVSAQAQVEKMQDIANRMTENIMKSNVSKMPMEANTVNYSDTMNFSSHLNPSSSTRVQFSSHESDISIPDDDILRNVLNAKMPKNDDSADCDINDMDCT